MKVMLIILDGWGKASPSYGNAITSADTPTLDMIESSYPSLSLQASGIAVGLPWGEEGNSEVGHLNIGAGRVVPQYLPRIISAIRDGSFFENEALKNATHHVKKNNSSIHFIGLVSSGSVHSYIDHLYGLLDLAKREGIANVFLHIFTDGKDSPPQEAAKLIMQLDERLRAQGQGSIATIIGRVYAMDRNDNWQATQKTYDLLIKGAGEKISDPIKYIEDSYTNGTNDQYIEPAVINSNFIKEGDAVVFFNFREDSARQLTRAFVEDGFDKFPRKKLQNLFFVTMTEYLKDLPLSNVAFPPIYISATLSQVLSLNGKKQLHMAESEKYAHVTYFFNSLMEKPYPGEERFLVTSQGAPHYDQYPEMQAQKITDKALESIDSFDFMLINFANADMLAHSGNIQAAILGIQTIDKCVQRIIEAKREDTTILITSDHGNAEEMLNLKTGAPKTKHTANPVPFYFIGPSTIRQAADRPKGAAGQAYKKERRYSFASLNKKPKGILADVAPTVLDVMELAKPKEMTGQSLMPLLISS